MTPLQQLIQLKEQYNKAKAPNFPYPVKPKYSDKTANGLTKCVIDWLNLSGWQAERISTSGRYVDNREIVTNVLNQTYAIGSGKWIPGSGTPGSADISATIKGRSIKIEVKMKDKQSQAQKEYQASVERAGGVYWLVHSFDEFHKFYTEFLNR